MAITYVSKFGLPAQCTGLTDLGSRVSELFSYKSSALWHFLQCSEHRQACQLGENLTSYFIPPFFQKARENLCWSLGVF